MKLKALIRQKQLRLSHMQQRLRKDVAMEQWLLKECQTTTLMEWRHCRRADPEASEPDMSYKDPTPTPSLARPSQAAQIEIARQAVAPYLHAHLESLPKNMVQLHEHINDMSPGPCCKCNFMVSVAGQTMLVRPFYGVIFKASIGLLGALPAGTINGQV